MDNITNNLIFTWTSDKFSRTKCYYYTVYTLRLVYTYIRIWSILLCKCDVWFSTSKFSLYVCVCVCWSIWPLILRIKCMSSVCNLQNLYVSLVYEFIQLNQPDQFSILLQLTVDYVCSQTTYPRERAWPWYHWSYLAHPTSLYNPSDSIIGLDSNEG